LQTGHVAKVITTVLDCMWTCGAMVGASNEVNKTNQ